MPRRMRDDNYKLDFVVFDRQADYRQCICPKQEPRQLDRQTHLDEVRHTSFRMAQAFPPGHTRVKPARFSPPTVAA